jgi:hypothetical protein
MAGRPRLMYSVSSTAKRKRAAPWSTRSRARGVAAGRVMQPRDRRWQAGCRKPRYGVATRQNLSRRTRFSTPFSFGGNMRNPKCRAEILRWTPERRGEERRASPPSRWQRASQPANDSGVGVCGRLFCRCWMNPKQS